MRQFVACVLLTAATGCASYESTYLTRDREGNPATTTVSGVPIVVTVPQKIGFIATESRYRVTAGGQPRIVTETTIDRTPIPLGASHLANLDIKRPLFGTAETSMKLANQYPTELASKVDDKTLEKVLELVEKVPKSGLVGAGSDGTKTLIGQRSYMIVYDPETQRISRVRF